MRAYKCDICGKYFNMPYDVVDEDRTIDGFKNAYRLFFANDYHSSSRGYDFCKECGIKLKNFITGGREENE